MDSFTHLSIPSFYQYRPIQAITDIVYTIIPGCDCVSDEKFDNEILDVISEADSNTRKHRTTRKKNMIMSQKVSKTNSKPKPVLKIY
jgi:hypothetical protein